MKQRSENVHGVFMKIQGAGVLIMGKSGSGKSATALSLIAQGYQLIADDAPLFSRKGKLVIGTCPKLLKNFLEVHCIGIINIAKLFGKRAIASQHRLDLIIQLKRQHEEAKRLPTVKIRKLLGIAIPEFTLPAYSPHLLVLIQCLIRDYFLKQQGYDAQKIFISKHKERL